MMSEDPAVYLAQAQRIVAAQAGCSMDGALDLMSTTADSSDSTMEEVAALVIEGLVRFDR
jgi:AmiR/NasT family two-component response regulator